jgi:polyhydroxybutyrate depolymerase
MEWLTRQGFNRIADRESAIVVYPDGIAAGWNDGRAAVAERTGARNIDDLGYLRALPRALASRFAVDPLRVYAAGMSNGGIMSLRLACEAADVFAAVAAVAANLPRELASRCKPSRAISVALIGGTEDPIMPWQGGTIKVMQSERGEVLSAAETVDRWVRLDHCGPLRAGERLDMQADDQTAVIPHTARCIDDTEVQLHEVQGGGHTWPSGEQYLPEAIVGRVSREIDANEVIWNFVVQHRLSESAEETKL